MSEENVDANLSETRGDVGKRHGSTVQWRLQATGASLEIGCFIVILYGLLRGIHTELIYRRNTRGTLPFELIGNHFSVL